MNEKLTLRELCIKHDYYCSDNNYYSNQAALYYDTFSDFYSEFRDADVDMNLVFRWDVKESSKGTHLLQIFMMNQRNGIYRPIYISVFNENDVELFVKYLKPHIEKLKSIWKPFEF